MQIAARLMKLGLASLILTCSTALATAGPAFPQDRAPVPTKEANAEALRELRDMFREEYKAHDVDSRRELAEELVEESWKFREESLGHYYACLDEARRLASEVQGIRAGFAAIGLMDKTFEVDGQTLKVQFIEEIADDVRPKERCDVLSEALPLIEECVDSEAYKAARKLLASLGSFEKSCGDAEVEQAVAMAKHVCAEAGKIERSRKKLKSNSDDAKANERVGRFYCFVRVDFETGLPMLEKSADKRLKRLAETDLDMDGDPKKQTALGEEWLEYAERSKDEDERSASASRAVHWLKRVLRSELEGLLLVRAERRLKRALELSERAPVPMSKPVAAKFPATGKRRSSAEVQASLVNELASLKDEYEEHADTARVRLLAGMDKVISKVRGKLKRKSDEVQAGALNPLVADRDSVSASDTNIPTSPDFGSVAAAYEKDSAAARAKHRKRVMRIVRKLRQASGDDAADEAVMQLESYCPKTISCEVFSRSMEDIVAKYGREVIYRQIAVQAVEIRDALFALHGKAQAGSISAVDLTSQAKELRLSIINSTPYKVGNTKAAKGGQKKAYPLFIELEDCLDEVLLKAK